jgi:hypothetical protein
MSSGRKRQNRNRQRGGPQHQPPRVRKKQQDSHVILLYQYTADHNTKSFREFNSLNQAVQAIITLFEQLLQAKHPTSTKISYDLSNLYKYIDDLEELVMLRLDSDAGMYAPMGKTKIKQQVLRYLRSQSE